MASLMDMYSMRYRPVDQDRRKKIRGQVDSRDIMRQALALNQQNPTYQSLISGAEGGPFAVGSVGNIAKGAASALKYVPFLRHSIPVARGAKKVARGAKRAVWQPGTKPKVNTKREIVTPGTSGRVRPGAVATGLTLAELGALGVANKDTISDMLGGTPEEQTTTPVETVTPKVDPVIAPGITQARVGSSRGIQPQSVTEAGFQADVATLPDYSGDMYNISPVGNLPAKVAPTKDPVNQVNETPENAPSLWKTWGSLADDPKKRRDAYLGSIKNIYMKKMLLDSIANLTGGVSQGGSWAEMAIAELDAVEKFDSEQRLHNQWKALFFNENGDYNPPKNRKEAMERGQQLDYNSDQMKDIMTVFPKETDDRTTLQKNISFVLAMEESPMKRSLMKKHGLIETDDLTAAERAADRAVRDGIITEKEKDAYIRSIYVPTDKTKGGVTTEQFDIWKKKTKEAVTDQEKADALTYGIMVKAVDRKNPDMSIREALALLENIDKGIVTDEDGELTKYANLVLRKQANLSATTTTPTDSPSGITITKKP